MVTVRGRGTIDRGLDVTAAILAPRPYEQMRGTASRGMVTIAVTLHPSATTRAELATELAAKLPPRWAFDVSKV